jgi:ribonuclease BN (tRNA processing enzyme)
VARAALHGTLSGSAALVVMAARKADRMSIRVLGCSGAIAQGCRTTAFLLDDQVLIDAGTGVGDLGMDELLRIEHIFLSHSHLDHILAVGLLADTVARHRAAAHRAPITVHALPATLAALRQHIFNDVIWPDFTKLPSEQAPTLRLSPLAPGERLALPHGRFITVLPAAHSVPAVGFAVQAGEGPAWVFSGDTGPNPALWRALRSLVVAELVIETAFSDAEAPLARVSGHLNPASLATELAALAPEVAVYITHAKPGELHSIWAEVQALCLPQRVQALAVGERFELRAG